MNVDEVFGVSYFWAVPMTAPCGCPCIGYKKVIMDVMTFEKLYEGEPEVAAWACFGHEEPKKKAWWRFLE